MRIKKGLITRPVTIGRIAIGMKDQRGLPRKLDHFIFTKPKPDENGVFQIDEYVTEIMEAAHGRNPKVIDVMLPFDTPQENFQSMFACYKKPGSPECIGDGEIAKRKHGGEWQQVPCDPNTCTFQYITNRKGQQIKACSPRGILYVYLPKVAKSGGVFTFRTSSIISITNLTSNLDNLYDIVQRAGRTLKFLPCKLYVEPQKVTIENGSTQTVYVVRLEWSKSVEDAIAGELAQGKGMASIALPPNVRQQLPQQNQPVAGSLSAPMEELTGEEFADSDIPVAQAEVQVPAGSEEPVPVDAVPVANTVPEAEIAGEAYAPVPEDEDLF